MNLVKSNRIESIDILRGLVMVIMALDHTRDYFHFSGLNAGGALGPTDLATTTPFLFFTRFITHYCAPVFVFLAGTSAYLYGSRKTKNELFKFLFTRGLWLIILEIFINNLIWQFDLGFNFIMLQVIWAIGISMICLSLLIYLPKKILLIIGFILIFGHNLFDGIVMKGNNLSSILWYILHQRQGFSIDSGQIIVIGYPIIPWIGVIVLGYCFGTLYVKDFNSLLRKKWLLFFGLGSVILFLILRAVNIYGNLDAWSVQKNTMFTILSFLNVTKYPPSLDFILITLGPSMLFLIYIENVKNKITEWLLVFGRVPLFYYFIHVLLIHTFAVASVLISGNWQNILLDDRAFSPVNMAKYGYSLFVVYLVWIVIVLLLYIPCKKYMIYKASNRDKWWLSYL
jgi:uncharacterized membrane protein